MTLMDHLATGATTVARCWRVVRADGEIYGFTDHDAKIVFEDTDFMADSGLSAAALSQTTGLSVDNSEAVGALSSDLIREADILAGRFDGAEVEAWLVNWADPAERVLQFRGTLGEIERAAGAFTAELRGLAEALNRPEGRVFQAQCPATLGDGRCGVDLSDSAVSVVVDAVGIEEAQVFTVAGLELYAERWFERGRLEVLDGPATGLVHIIKGDRLENGARRITLWERVRAEIAVGARLRLVAGCDKRPETCRTKFDNFANFRGFPHLPGEDWLMAYPRRGGTERRG